MGRIRARPLRWMMQYQISHSEMVRMPGIVEVCPRIVALNMGGATSPDDAWDISVYANLQDGITLRTE